MRHLFWSCLFSFAALLAVASPAHALEGTWYAIPDTLTPVGERETYWVTAHTPDAVTTFQITFNCGAARPCSQSATAIRIGGVDQFVAGAFASPAPKRLFIFVHDASCTTRYGAASYLGVWSDTGGAPFIAQCFVAGRITLPNDVRPEPRPLPTFRLPTIPPRVLRPGPLPTPTPSPARHSPCHPVDRESR